MPTRTQHPRYDLRHQQHARVRDVLDGVDQVKNEGQTYLPKPSGMDTDQYVAYKTRAHFLPVAERTLRGLSGIALAKAPRIELPARLVPMIESATFQGHSLDVLIQRVMDEVLSVGHVALLLDFPVSGTTPTSTPHIATFHAENILDYREEIVGGRSKLTMVRLHEDHDLDDEVEQHLLLILDPETSHYTVQRLHRDGDVFIPSEEIVPMINGAPLDHIPIVFVSPYSLDPEPPKPPMLDLSDIVLSHYRNSADLEHTLFLTSQPTPWVAGAINENNKPRLIGAGAFWVLPEGAAAGMLEPSGNGIQHLREHMADKKEEMAAQGARMLTETQVRSETSETFRMRNRTELSLLASSVRMVEAGLRRLLQWSAVWTNSDPADVVVEFNRDLIAAPSSPDMVKTLVQAWQSGAISHTTLLINLQRGEIIPPERSPDDEIDLISEEGGLPNLQAV